MSGIPERGYGTWAQWLRRKKKRDGWAEFHVTSLDEEVAEGTLDAWCFLHMPDPIESKDRTVAETTKDTAHG